MSDVHLLFVVFFGKLLFPGSLLRLPFFLPPLPPVIDVNLIEQISGKENDPNMMDPNHKVRVRPDGGDQGIEQSPGALKKKIKGNRLVKREFSKRRRK